MRLPEIRTASLDPASVRRHGRRRAGYVLAWVIMMVAVVAALAAVAAPVLATAHDIQRVEDTRAIVSQIAAGVVAFEAAVHSSNNNNDYPGQISQLSNPIRPGVDLNSCGIAMNTRDSTDWITNGPFLTMYAPTDGLWTPLGRISDNIPVRPSSGAKGALYIDIPGMSMSDALLTDSLVDHSVGDTITILHPAPDAPLPDTTTLRIRLLSASQVATQC